MLLAVVGVAAVGARRAVIDFASGDYRNFLLPWWNHIVSHGRFHAMRSGFADYTPPYLYVLTALTYTGITPLHAIKGFGLLCDVGLAVAVAGLVSTRSRSLAYVAGAVMLLAPTVFLNSAVWGQNDAMYTLFLVAAVWASALDRPLLTTVLFGMGLAIKAQAAFLLPWIVVLAMRGRLRARHVLAIPAVYVVAVMPAWALGRPLGQLLLVYRDQANVYHQLTLNFSNLYQWLPAQVPGFKEAGLWFGLAVAAGVCFVGARASAAFDSRTNVLFALWCAVLLPFVLPGMHDRYFFPADVLAIAYAFFDPRRWWLAVVVSTISLLSYMPFLFGTRPVNLQVVALGVLAVAAYLTADVIRTLGGWSVDRPGSPAVRRR